VAFDPIVSLVLFMALMLALSLHGLAASGHFPRVPESPAGPGPLILFASVAVAALCAVAGVVTAVRFIPWYAVIIGGGLALLCAPLVLQKFSDRFVDGGTSLIAFAAAGILLTMTLLVQTGGPVLP
jgi:hypothetical protein